MFKIQDLEIILQNQRQKEKQRDDTKLYRINESMISINSVKEKMHDAQTILGIKRDKNEDPDLRKCRKEAVKMLKKEKREFKKTLKEE